MKQQIKFSVLLGFVIIFTTAVLFVYGEQTKIKPPDWTNLYGITGKLVAHAGGQIAEFPETNTIEAMEHNYNLGHRLFEMDLNLTSDNIMVAIHDWGS
ncbi:MAG: hypothetical protein LBQ68_06745, partial [Clostridiales bacterium]|nr:hypothetical protein [Clostridiales bacterium]